jgi:hypothetical protein
MPREEEDWISLLLDNKKKLSETFKDRHPELVSGSKLLI